MKIDFYILEATSGQKSLFFACELLEKIHAEQRRVYVNTHTRDEAERFDALLWTYREDSFIPHNLFGINDDTAPSIQIGADKVPEHHHDVLLNLARDIPPFYKQFNTIIEIVFADPLVQQMARDRYKQYREQGFEINTIKLKVNES